MNDFRINFTLRPPAEIAPWGEKGDYLSWFGLTDSELWITVGERTIYEYTDAACKEWEHDIRHNDYYLSRFLGISRGRSSLSARSFRASITTISMSLSPKRTTGNPYIWTMTA